MGSIAEVEPGPEMTEFANSLAKNFDWVTVYWPSAIWPGLMVTVKLLILSATFGFPLAILVGIGRISKNRVIFAVSSAFVSVIRGTPLLVQMFILYRGLGSLLPLLHGIRNTMLWPVLADGFYYVTLALSLSLGGYVGEIVRTALLSVPSGELQAARTLGFRGTMLFRRIWLPRALYNVVPTLAGETVLLLKSTALASQVAVLDILGQINVIRSETAITYAPLLTVAVVYMIFTFLIERGFKRVEKASSKFVRVA